MVRLFCQDEALRNGGFFIDYRKYFQKSENFFSCFVECNKKSVFLSGKQMRKDMKAQMIGGFILMAMVLVPIFILAFI